jgi:ribose transport system ATP-binding protein
MIAERGAPASVEPPATGAPLLRIAHLSKYFSRNRALDSVSLCIPGGRVHVLVGQNGSGKSTLIKVLAGYHLPEPQGVVEVEGQHLRFGHPEHAYRLGCRFVHQDPALIADTSVVDNLFLGGRYPMRRGRIDTRTAARMAHEMLERVELDIPVRQKVGDLSPSQRTGVAIARALRPDAAFPVKVLVLDEPTATLPANEVDHLVAIVQAAAGQGVAILYVTHHINEVFRLGSEITVLRDGMAVHSGPTSRISEAEIVAHLTGDAEDRTRSPARAVLATEPPVCKVIGLVGPQLRGVSFDVAPGEVVGVVGITGSGREQLLGTVFGAKPRTSGEVIVNGKVLEAGRPDRAIALGVAFVPADRKDSGFASLSAQDNLTVLRLRSFWQRWRMRRRPQRVEALAWFERLQVRPAKAVKSSFQSFSGGNQQKLVFGRWLGQAVKVFLLDEPTQGVDVGAKAQLHQEISLLAGTGTAVVLSSTDLEELAALCTRVLVLRDGLIDRTIQGRDVTVAAMNEAVLSGASR